MVVTDLGDQEAEQLASALAAVEARQRAGLFPNGLRHAIVVHAAKPAGEGGRRLPGLFSPASRTLDVNVMVPFGTTVREFVRALHYDDQAAEGQVHAAWVRAGIAALYERTDSGTGAPHAVLDWRLDPKAGHLRYRRWVRNSAGDPQQKTLIALPKACVPRRPVRQPA